MYNGLPAAVSVLVCGQVSMIQHGVMDTLPRWAAVDAAAEQPAAGVTRVRPVIPLTGIGAGASLRCQTGAAPERRG